MSMPMKLRAALFDLDGVVLDTEGQYSILWKSLCRQFRPDVPGLENTIKGQTLTQILEGAFAGIPGAESVIVERLNDYEAQMDYDYIAGFQDFLASLKAHGVKTALVTSSNQPKMNSVYCKRPEIRNCFDAVLMAEDFTESKPHPQCYLKAAEVLGVGSDGCVVFEDSFNGLRAGRAAGMAVVGLATTNPRHDIKNLCDRVVDDFTDFTVEDCEMVLGEHDNKKS